MKAKYLALGALLVGLGRCGPTNSQDNKEYPPPVQEPMGPFHYASDFVPTADGSLYITDDAGNIWCIRGAEAVKVRKVESFSEQNLRPLSDLSRGWLWSMKRYAYHEGLDDGEEIGMEEAVEFAQSALEEEYREELDSWP